MKIAVYTIAKNEERFVGRWAESCREADILVVADTGSSDRTSEELRARGAIVQSIDVRPWRFDMARNLSLDLVPKDVDVCIALDLDEVLTPGWRAALEEAWNPSTTCLRYMYVAKLGPDGVTPDQAHYSFKIHARHAYRWNYAIHECLVPLGRHEEARTEGITVYHLQDESKDRRSYLGMLQDYARLEPNESRYSFYLGRELYSMAFFDRAIPEFERYLALPDAIHPGERACALRYIARARKALRQPTEQVIQTLLRATLESPMEREAWACLAQEMAELGNWPNCLAFATNALRNSDPSRSFLIEPQFWAGQTEHLLSLSADRLGIPWEKREWISASVRSSRL